MGARLAPDWPRTLRRSTAALYCDLTLKDFEREVAAGRLPAPIRFGSEEHWSRNQIDEHLDRLFGDKLPDWRANAKMYQK